MARAVVIRMDEENAVRALTRSEKIDRVVLDKIWGFPIMVASFGMLFAASFLIGQPISSVLGQGLDWIAVSFEAFFAGKIPNLAMSLLSDGVFRGIASALTFFPQMLLFFAFYSLISDTGYTARIAYLMHRPMSKLRMDSRAFAPLVLGYTCNVSTIIGARDIPSRTDRLIVMLVSSFTPCSARFAVILYIAAAFFNPLAATAVMCSLIVLSWLISAGVSYLLTKMMPERAAEVGEPILPPYQVPSLTAVLKAAFYRTGEFINRIKTVIMVSSVLVWGMSTFPLGAGFEHSYAAMIGHWLEPAGRIMGLNWQMIVSLIFGFFAKETTLATLGVLFHASEGLGNLGALMTAHISPLAGLAFLSVYMFYIPCLTTVTTIYKESGSKGFAAFSILVSLTVAFVLGSMIYNLGNLVLLAVR
ncbi:MAG: nucleoside recognition domain-containing protein [Solirubrobacterales bacterium]